MNSIRLKVTNPLGLHARPCADICTIAGLSPRFYERGIVYIKEGTSLEGNLLSVMDLMMAAAETGAILEILSAMPDEDWGLFCDLLCALFYYRSGGREDGYRACADVVRGKDDPAGKPSPEKCLEKLRLVAKTHPPDAFYFQRLAPRVGIAIPQNPPSPAGVYLNTGETRPPGESIPAAPPATPPSTPPKPRFLYKVFISKVSEDYAVAKRLFDFLEGHGVATFLSEVSVPRSETTDYQEVIEMALSHAAHLIVIGTRPQNFNSEWVKSEWRLFLSEKRAGRKQGNILTLRTPDVSIEQLPVALRAFQSEALVSDESFKGLLPYLS